ncbi:hypothetical protein E2C01_061722 [Portunus trituberculatus]|uniref:Uncharacterized protein n=1 Tax=Portunus trituberculatus TaxID=210409 RepID=A0A5B7HD62_PORTR|nr:hypothetical protein [Portunus trituberculatus]
MRSVVVESHPFPLFPSPPPRQPGCDDQCFSIITPSLLASPRGGDGAPVRCGQMGSIPNMERNEEY